MNVHEVTQSLRPGSFVLVDYDAASFGDQSPYVQSTPGPHGWYAEVSFEGRTADGWAQPNDVWLAAHGWRAPDADTWNWWHPALPASEVAEVLVETLVRAYRCADPGAIGVLTGSLPSGPRGGEPLREVAEDVILAA